MVDGLLKPRFSFIETGFFILYKGRALPSK